MIFILAGQPSLALTTLERTLYLNRILLAKNNIIIPLNGYRKWSHLNIIDEITRSPRFDPSLGTIANLCENIKKKKEINPDVNHLLSFTSLSRSYIGLTNNLCSQLRRVDYVTLITFVNHQLNYLYPYWYMERLNGNGLEDFHTWIKWRLKCNAFSSNYYKKYNQTKSLQSINKILYLHSDKFSSEKLLFDKLLQILDIDTLSNEILTSFDEPIKSILSKPVFCQEVKSLASDLYFESNEKLIKNFPELKALNNTIYLS